MKQVMDAMPQHVKILHLGKFNLNLNKAFQLGLPFWFPKFRLKVWWDNKIGIQQIPANFAGICGFPECFWMEKWILAFHFFLEFRHTTFLCLTILGMTEFEGNPAVFWLI